MTGIDLCVLCRGFVCDAHPDRFAVACRPRASSEHGPKCVECAIQVLHRVARRPANVTHMPAGSRVDNVRG